MKKMPKFILFSLLLSTLTINAQFINAKKMKRLKAKDNYKIFDTLIEESNNNMIDSAFSDSIIVNGQRFVFAPCAKCSTLISSTTFQTILEKDFAVLATGNNKIESMNSYAGVDLADSKIDFKIFIPFRELKHKSSLTKETDPDCIIWRNLAGYFKDKKDEVPNRIVGGVSFNLSSGFDDNIASVVKNNKFNNESKGGINFILGIFPLYNYSCDTKKKIESAIAQEKAKYDWKEFGKNNEIDLLKKQIEAKKALISAATLNTESYYQLRKDTNDLRLKIIELHEKDLKDEAAKAIRKIETDAQWETKWFFWPSIGAKFGFNKFFLYTPGPAVLFSDQATEKRAYSGSGNIKLNFYSNNSAKSYYNFFFSLGYELSYDNNLKELTKKDMAVSEKADSSNFTRQASKKFTVYQEEGNAKFAQNLYSNFTATAIWYPLQTKILTAGLRLYYQGSKKERLDASEKERLSAGTLKKWTHDTGFGLVASINNVKKDEPAVNFEFYFTFIDMGDSQNKKDTKFYQRNDIGFRLGVPFSVFKN